MSEEKATTLAELVNGAAADADKQFAGQDHVTEVQLSATADAAARKIAQAAQQTVADGLAAQILAAMKTKPRAPKPQPAQPAEK